MQAGLDARGYEVRPGEIPGSRVWRDGHAQVTRTLAPVMRERDAPPVETGQRPAINLNEREPPGVVPGNLRS